MKLTLGFAVSIESHAHITFPDVCRYDFPINIEGRLTWESTNRLNELYRQYTTPKKLEQRHFGVVQNKWPPTPAKPVTWQAQAAQGQSSTQASHSVKLGTKK
jgi:hypothetical protein